MLGVAILAGWRGLWPPVRPVYPHTQFFMRTPYGMVRAPESRETLPTATPAK